jgi:hypothetical protein
MKSKVYRRKVDTRDELLDHIMDVIARTTKIHSDEQHAMSSNELQRALMLTAGHAVA